MQELKEFRIWFPATTSDRAEKSWGKSQEIQNQFPDLTQSASWLLSRRDRKKPTGSLSLLSLYQQLATDIRSF